VLLTLAGANLIAHTHLLANPTPTAAIPPSASVAIVVDVVLPGQDASLRPAAAPAALAHRIRYQLPANFDPHVRPFIGSLRDFGPQTPVARTPPTVISPPLRGSGWVNFVGCCQPTALHRRLLYTANGQWIKGETFAIDWLQFRNGRPFAGDGSTNTQWYDFGSPVRAVAGGMVVRAIDGRPDNPPNTTPIMPNPDSFGGNYVVVRIHPGVYAQYAHLEKGSVAVRVGQRIRAGQQLGKLGNSGNSTAPHLHFGLINQPDFTIANSLPWVFNQFTFLGYLNRDTGQTTGTPHPAGREYPLLDSAAAFP
jgi:murein DD-endopeptidase MepM/ murein hydrolase activator NlpD